MYRRQYAGMTGWNGVSDTNNIKGGTICRYCEKIEESPDSTGHPAAESADRSNLVDTVTENNRILVMQG